MNLYEMEKALHANGYAKESLIFCGDDTILFKYTRLADATDSIWFLYTKTKQVRPFRELQFETMFTGPEYGKTSFGVADFREAVGDDERVFNNAQIASLMKSFDESLQGRLATFGYEQIRGLLDGCDFEICVLCPNVIGLLAEPDDDPEGTDTAYRLRDGGAVCGTCKDRKDFVACSNCDFHFMRKTMRQAEPDYGQPAWICGVCDKADREGW